MDHIRLQLPEGFLKEELRCGYLISSEMKKVWAVELDLLSQLQRVCDQYGIQYSVSGGTMLGAVRHHGFIPWDDDIDVMMMRDQYDELLRHADEFPEPYFFQTADRDEGYFTGHAQLRNSKTTALRKKILLNAPPYNQGIFIDIFPMDAIPDDDALRLQQGKRCDRYKSWVSRIYYGAHATTPTFRRKLSKIVYSCVGILLSPMRLYRRFENWCRKYNGEATQRVSKLCLKGRDEKLYQARTDFDDFVMMDFEMLRVPVIANYDQMLRYKYGDYMEFVVSHGYHGEVLFDTKMPYQDTILELRDKGELPK